RNLNSGVCWRRHSITGVGSSGVRLIARVACSMIIMGGTITRAASVSGWHEAVSNRVSFTGKPTTSHIILSAIRCTCTISMRRFSISWDWIMNNWCTAIWAGAIGSPMWREPWLKIFWYSRPMKSIHSLLLNLLVGLLAFIVFFILFESRIAVPPALQVLGRAHPLFLHFPIVLLVLAWLLACFGKRLLPEAGARRGLI